MDMMLFCHQDSVPPVLASSLPFCMRGAVVAEKTVSLFPLLCSRVAGDPL